MINTDMVRGAMERHGVPGLAVGVVHGDHETLLGFGVTSVANPLEVDADTLFQIGSVTKTYTATAAMRLVDAGELALDDPVRKYIPDLRLADPEVAASVTMRHLLTHTGGWEGDYFDPIGPGDDALARMMTRLDRLEQLTPLGEVWSYNNSGFYIAGRVIEIVTGQTFERALRELVLEPLGLTRSFFSPADVMIHRFVVGHDRSGAVASPWFIGRPAAPAGGLIASIRDVIGYARAQWENDSLLAPASVDEMRRPHVRIGATPGASMGIGWGLGERDDHFFMSHTGGTNGQEALLVVAPRERFALAVLTNNDNGGAVQAEIQQEVMGSVLGVEPAASARHECSAGDLSEYVGEYHSRLYGARLSLQEGELTLTLLPKGGFPEPDSPAPPAPPATRMALEHRDALVALDPPHKGARSDFVRDAEGEIAWYRLSGRLLRRSRQ